MAASDPEVVQWRDRVVGLERIPAGELRANPKNWRLHSEGQQTALLGILEEVGIAGALIGRKTDDGIELIDGHLRAEIADDQPWPVLIVDVNPEEADKLLAAIDPIGELATRDDRALIDLLKSFETESEALGGLFEELRVSAEITIGDWGTDFVPPEDDGLVPAGMTVFRVSCAEEYGTELLNDLRDALDPEKYAKLKIQRL